MTTLHDATLSQRFERFHAENPRVYQELMLLAYEWKRRTGGRKLGMKSLYERVRWELALATSDPDFKLNNSFTPFYARLLMLRNPELRGLFDCRISEADEWARGLAA